MEGISPLLQAADEMKERLATMLGEEVAKKLFAGTFHGWVGGWLAGARVEGQHRSAAQTPVIGWGPAWECAAMVLLLWSLLWLCVQPSFPLLLVQLVLPHPEESHSGPGTRGQRFELHSV